MGFRPYLNLSQIISKYLIFASNVQNDAKKVQKCKNMENAKTCKNAKRRKNMQKSANKCKKTNKCTQVLKKCKKVQNTSNKCKQGQNMLTLRSDQMHKVTTYIMQNITDTMQKTYTPKYTHQQRANTQHMQEHTTCRMSVCHSLYNYSLLGRVSESQVMSITCGKDSGTDHGQHRSLQCHRQAQGSSNGSNAMSCGFR